MIAKNAFKLNRLSRFHKNRVIYCSLVKPKIITALLMTKSEGRFFDRTFGSIVPSRLWNALPPDLKNVIQRKTANKARLKKTFWP
jgi:hypothetical protein